MMKIVTFILFIFIMASDGFTNDWKFVGPDSTNWRSVTQMDASFNTGRAPYIAVGTTEGVAINTGNSWRYVFPDVYGNPTFPPEEIAPRSVYFSPWEDSVAFVGANIVYSGEPGSIGGRISNIYNQSWSINNPVGGGYVGENPSLSFAFSPHHTGYVYTWIIDFYKSTDNGLWWQFQPGSDSYGVLFLVFDQQQDLVLYAGKRPDSQPNFGLYRSTDDGSSWQLVRPLPVSAPPLSQKTADFLAKGDTLILALNRFPSPPDTASGIAVSTDNGNTWSQVLSTLNVQKITANPAQPGVIYAAAQGGIYYSENGGVSWQLFTDSLPSQNLMDIRKDPDSDTLYIATSDSGVYKVFDSSVGIYPRQTQLQTFRLYQNFPNPFNPETTISYDLPQRAHVHLTVYDQLGRKVAVMVNDTQNAGLHAATFTLSNLASGFYFYRLRAGDVVQTRKMLLLK